MKVPFTGLEQDKQGNHQVLFLKCRISLKFQTDTVEDDGDLFKSLQSELNELKLFDLTLVLDGTPAQDSTNGDQTLYVAESATTEDKKILNFCQ